jgi:hypothetical protein
MSDTKFMAHISKLMKTSHLTYEQALEQTYKDYGITPIVENPLPMDIVEKVPGVRSPRQDKLPVWSNFTKGGEKDGNANE